MRLERRSSWVFRHFSSSISTQVTTGIAEVRRILSTDSAKCFQCNRTSSSFRLYVAGTLHLLTVFNTFCSPFCMMCHLLSISAGKLLLICCLYSSANSTLLTTLLHSGTMLEKVIIWEILGRNQSLELPLWDTPKIMITQGIGRSSRRLSLHGSPVQLPLPRCSLRMGLSRKAPFGIILCLQLV
jgi:hypothetical protein